MKKLILVCLALAALLKLQAQINVVADTNTVQLVNNFILFGVSASNVQYTGGAQTLGSFTNGNTTNIGITDGIVMTTGTLALIGSPVTEFATAMSGGGSDSSLQNILPGYTLQDASILEFDLIPVGNVLEFNYVFASEEYPEFVNSAFNDVFGFFINGPDPQGGNYADLNIALIPGTTLPVAIDNVNAGNNATYYVDNQTLNGQTIVYDGFTTPLLAQVDVVPQSTYHLKMAIADAGDAAYDSGIFLKAQSMKSYMVTAVENTGATSPNVFPNPATDYVIVKGPAKAMVALYNMQGQCVYSNTITDDGLRINTGFLQKGFYFLTQTTDARTETYKLVIK